MHILAFCAKVFWGVGMEPLVVYIYDHSSGYQPLMEQQLDKKGIQRLPVEIPAFTWGNRIKQTQQIAEQYPERLLFVVDAWDTLFLGDKSEMDSQMWKRGITFASQKRCWPDAREAEYEARYGPQDETRWKYLNSNPMVGYGAYIANAIKWGWERFPLPGHTNDTCDPEGNVCERFYTNLLFQAPIHWGLRVDTQCILAQTTTNSNVGELAVRDGRICNLITGTRPMFLHLNGKMVFDVSLLDA